MINPSDPQAVHRGDLPEPDPAERLARLAWDLSTLIDRAGAMGEAEQSWCKWARTAEAVLRMRVAEMRRR
jgi:hypothetical protein